MTITLYGIRYCDTMKKARAWLDARGVAYVFHDYKRPVLTGAVGGPLVGFRVAAYDAALPR